MDSFLEAYYGGGMYDDDSDDGDQWWSDDPRFEGYTHREIEQNVTFLRPQYDEETDEFDYEGKDIGWCISNGFEEVKDGVWSGSWYWKHRGGEAAREKRLLQNKQQRQTVKLERERVKASRVLCVEKAAFDRIQIFKEQGNAAFKEGCYDRALVYYGQAHEVRPYFQAGVCLGGVQKEEKVKIISNQAECYLRLGQYQHALMVASEALALDKHHEKSLIRRAKATYKGCVLGGGNNFHPGLTSVDPISASQATEDLEKVIRMGGRGAADAQRLLDEINAVLRSELERLQAR